MSRRARTSRRYFAAMGLMGLLGVAGLSGSTATAAGQVESTAVRGCTVLDHAIEQTAHMESVGSVPPMRKPGDASVYFNNIYNSAHATIGHAVGYVTGLYTRSFDHHLITVYYDSVQLDGGTIRATGVIDRDAALKGAPVRFDAVGTSGSYLGEHGYREWRLLSLEEGTAAVRIVMCR